MVSDMFLKNRSLQLTDFFIDIRTLWPELWTGKGITESVKWKLSYKKINEKRYWSHFPVQSFYKVRVSYPLRNWVQSQPPYCWWQKISSAPHKTRTCQSSTDYVSTNKDHLNQKNEVEMKDNVYSSVLPSCSINNW